MGIDAHVLRVELYILIEKIVKTCFILCAARSPFRSLAIEIIACLGIQLLTHHRSDDECVVSIGLVADSLVDGAVARAVAVAF